MMKEWMLLASLKIIRKLCLDGTGQEEGKETQGKRSRPDVHHELLAFAADEYKLDRHQQTIEVNRFEQ